MKVKAVKSFVSNSICMAIGEVMEFPDAEILPFINAGLAVVYTETGESGNAPNNTVQEAVVSKK